MQTKNEKSAVESRRRFFFAEQPTRLERV